MNKEAPKDIGVIKINSIIKNLKFSIPLSISVIIGVATVQLDKILVSFFCSPREFIFYSNGAIEIPLISIITGSIATVIIADLSNYAKEGRNSEALKLFRNAAEKSALILVPATLFFFICAESFITTIYSDKYIESVIPFKFYILMLPAKIVYYGAALIAYGKYKLMFIRSIVSMLLNLLLASMLIKLVGYIGASIASLVILYVFDVSFNLNVLAKCFKTNYLQILPLNFISKIFIVSAIASLPILILNNTIPLTESNSLLLFIISLLLFILLFIYLAIKSKLIRNSLIL